MNKILRPATSTIEAKVMQKIHTDQPRMRSRFHYLYLSALSVAAIMLLTFITAYFVSIATLWLRIRTAAGPAYGAKQNLAILTSTFPWWALLLGLASLASVIYLIKITRMLYKIRLLYLVPAVVALLMALGFILSYSTLPAMFTNYRSTTSCSSTDVSCAAPGRGNQHRR